MMCMNPRQNVLLRDYSTMRLGGPAAWLVEVHDQSQLVGALAWADERQLPVIMIGGGSNIFWQDDGFAGLVMVNRILGYDDAVDGDRHQLTIGAGENWDSVVARSVTAGLTGIECLSLIPGSTGATPVQNVGAYGQEISNTLVNVTAYDRQAGAVVTIANQDCAFGYRTSRFKTVDKQRFFITAITLQLSAGQLQPPFYAGLQRYLDEHHITDYSPASLRSAVIAVRSAKLPDPATVANNGSFFANPVVSQAQFEQLAANYTELPHWPVADGVKLSGAWLIEQIGLKNAHDAATGMATWPSQPLVLVNEHAKSTSDLLAFRQKITDAVQAKFGIELHQEPELLP